MNELARHYPGPFGTKGSYTPAPVEETTYYYADQSEDTHLRHYWNILRKRMRSMTAVFLDVVLLGVLITLASPTLYTARSTLKIEPQNPTVTGVAGVAESLPGQSEAGPYDYYQTQFAMLKSEPVRARVIKNLNLEKNSAFTGNTGPGLVGTFFNWIDAGIGNLKSAVGMRSEAEQAPQPARASADLDASPWLLGLYSRYLTVEPVRNTRLVDVIFNTPDPKLSQDLANNHATSFIQMILENRFSLTKEAKDFLGERLAELRDKVQKAEVKLNRFRQEHGVVSFDKGENIAVDRLVDLNKVLTKARADRIEAESLYRVTREKNTEHLSNVLSNSLIQQIKGSLANLEAEKGRLLSIFTPEHPRIQELNQQITEARRGLRGEISNIVRGIESSYAAARAREDSLDKEAKTQQEAALSLKEVGVEYAVLNEEVVVNRGLYENVLKRLHETNVANDLAASNMQIVQRASLPRAPSSPNWPRNLIVAVILGLLLAVGLAFFLEYMDVTVHTPQGVWAAVSLTTLGVVPHLKSLPGKCRPAALQGGSTKHLQSTEKSNHAMSKELVMAQDEISLTAESYRTIRSALLLSRAEHPPKVILLTSPSPGEGKTVTTVNLGMALAQSEQMVVVVDADLRKGRCHKLVNVPNQNGLVNVLTGQIGLRSSIKATAVRNFFVLPRGVLPPNPADLLMSHKMREVLNELRRSFDFVLIDSPPAIAVSDAAVVSAFCDGVLLVLHAQKTSAHAARQAVERLDSIGATTLGVILNGVDIRNPDYVDYRSYYPTYYASMQAESQTMKHGDNGWNFSSEQSDDIISNVADVDRVMENLGFKAGPDTAARESERLRVPNGVVTRQFFDRMSAALSEALGPRAFAVIADQVADFRESMDSFPISRLWELAQRVSQEILDQAVKARFLKTMSQEIHALAH
ncbi:MAG TPA: polysaccharide biosynthesis tyrosine autokinase [Candidatus Binatia bacterium]|nr:polysaccharide biosynthesis tyrosine autokinase [Candidatus Binatia bacterium]